jgi:hypothetical protein
VFWATGIHPFNFPLPFAQNENFSLEQMIKETWKYASTTLHSFSAKHHLGRLTQYIPNVIRNQFLHFDFTPETFYFFIKLNMAIASPEELKKMQQEIPQFQAEGKVVSSILETENNCFLEYKTVLNTKEDEIEFSYFVDKTPWVCIYDGLYPPQKNPIEEGKYIEVNIRNEEPHFLISYEEKFIPTSFLPYVYIGAFFLILLILLIFLSKTEKIKKFFRNKK